MYACIEVALRGDAHGIERSNWTKGRDPSGTWVQYPNPAVPSIQRQSSWIILAHLRALSDPTKIGVYTSNLFNDLDFYLGQILSLYEAKYLGQIFSQTFCFIETIFGPNKISNRLNKLDV